MAPSLAPLSVDVDPYVQAYEAARRSAGGARVRDHLPPADHPDHARVLAELIRVDLEYAWAGGTPRSVADYLAEFPGLADHPRLVGELAFEEYRQRLECGEDPDPREYRDRYGADIGTWPPDDRLAPTAVVGIAVAGRSDAGP